MTSSKRNTYLLLYIVALCITFVAFLALVIAEVYVRWSMNQTFSFLEGGVQPLAIVLFAQFAGLAYLLKSDN